MSEVAVEDNYYSNDELFPIVKIHSHNVNIWKAGVYFINYEVTDPSGNKSQIMMRPVFVKYPPNCINSFTSLNDITLEVPDASFSHFDVMAKSFAKTLSIKKGTQLSEKEQEELVNNLFSCKEPLVSPFGKPTFKTLTLNEIDNLFNQ